MKAVWNGVVLAESDDTLVHEGSHYFPSDALDQELFRDSSHRTHDALLGEASYFDVIAGGAVNANAAWTFREPGAGAARLRDRVAFGEGVDLVA